MAQLKWYSFRWRFGLFLLVGAFAVWYLLAGRFQHPIGEGPAGPPVDPAPFKHVWSQRDVVLLGLGDSITAGFGSSTCEGYFGLLVNGDDECPCDLSDVFPKMKAINRAVSGSISQQHLDDVSTIRAFDRNVFGVVVMSTGGNDIIHDYGKAEPRDGAMYGCTYEQALGWSKNYRKRLRGIIQGVDASFPGGCEIFIANIYDPTDGVGDIQNAHLMLPRWRDAVKVLGLFNQTIEDTCKEYPNVHLVDVHSEFLGHGIHCRQWWNKHYRRDDPNYWYYSNLEDPNDRGYDAIRRLFLIEMVKVLPSESKG
jgi:lysophospholipase L1-like esterase